jgi:hypothetical protein
VIYFATLPYKLQDASVRKFIEETTIKDKQYDVVGVTLGQDGGGFDDEFHYWINKQTHKVDLAYSYRTNDGALQNRF